MIFTKRTRLVVLATALGLAACGGLVNGSSAETGRRCRGRNERLLDDGGHRRREIHGRHGDEAHSEVSYRRHPAYTASASLSPMAAQ
jgi:hypothetical protein